MRIILVSKRHGSARSINFGGWTRLIASACLIGIPIAVVAVANKWMF